MHIITSHIGRRLETGDGEDDGWTAVFGAVRPAPLGRRLETGDGEDDGDAVVWAEPATWLACRRAASRMCHRCIFLWHLSCIWIGPIYRVCHGPPGISCRSTAARRVMWKVGAVTASALVLAPPRRRATSPRTRAATSRRRSVEAT